MQNLTLLGNEYLALDKCPHTHKEMTSHLQEASIPTLTALLCHRLEFGTAGLRGPMGAGYSRMNELVVIQATQGLAAHLLATIPECRERGVVIGHDHRHNSIDFAQLTAAVFLAKNIKVFYYPNLVHTPMVPFGVVQMKACAGVMITASHNPKLDNGYKVYAGNGCQIVSPTDGHIAAKILENLVPWTWDKTLIETSPLCSDPTVEMTAAYFRNLKSLSKTKGEVKTDSKVKICYTPMHGVGLEFAVRAVSEFGLTPFTSVPSQMHPDPEFPTVVFPNPEEKGALDEAMKWAGETGCDIIFANDPDADRFAIAESVDGKWKIFTGNQLGIVLAGFVLESFRDTNGKLPSDLAVLTTAVSSHMLEELARVESIHFDETLTGFKWLGNRAIELEKEGKTVVFAFEEAIGYMCSDFVKDKDGVTALAIFYERSNQLYLEGKTVSSYLNTLYLKYGYWVSHNSYFICKDGEKTRRIFDKIRFGSEPTADVSGRYPFKIAYPQTLAGFKVVSVRDLTIGYDSTKADFKPSLLVSSASQMLTFRLENQCLVTLRTSGTEPKIKYYTEFKGDQLDTAQKMLDEMVVKIIDELLQPTANGL